MGALYTWGLPTGQASGLTAIGSYSTGFSLTENPLSEGGIWLNGLTDGLDWTDPKVTADGCVASTTPTPSRYSDDIAHLKTSFRVFTPNQYAQGTVYKAGGYTGGGGAHELELLLRFSISGHDAHGYEVAWGFNASFPSGYMFIVRWNGAAGDYTTLWSPAEGVGSYLSSIFLYSDGDTFRAEVTGTVITVFANGVQMGQYDTASDGTKWSSGQPGLGFWPVDGATPASAGWKAYSTGNL